MSDRDNLLADLHHEIDACVCCRAFTAGFAKPMSMERGQGRDLMVIGQGPGRTEIRSGRAFSGPSGTKLDAWLVACGAGLHAPRQRIYATSVLKCAGDQRDLRRMAAHCHRFLMRQLELIRPKLVISLGQQAYKTMTCSIAPYAKALCCLQEGVPMLVQPFPVEFPLLVWPHPSGLNRWLNEPKNATKLENTFAIVGDRIFRGHP